jgi:hypothetical protein
VSPCNHFRDIKGEQFSATTVAFGLLLGKKRREAAEKRRAQIAARRRDRIERIKRRLRLA